MKKLLKTAIVGLAFLGASASASGLSGGHITFVSPFPPGGGTDTLTRILADSMAQEGGWNIVVENKPGAGGNVALDSTARARADGRTLVMAQTDNIVLNPWLYKKLSYDTFEDFVPVGLVATSPSVFVVAPESPYTTIADVVEAAKTKPGDVTLGIPGIGGTGDLLGTLWGNMADIELSHIPYRGWSQAYPDLVSGLIEVYTGSVASLLPHINGGSVRALGVIADERSPSLPDVPTFAESGFPELTQSIWWGLAAPAGTPDDVIQELNTALIKAIDNPKTNQLLQTSGYDPLGSSPEEMAERHRVDHDLFGEVIKDSGLEPQ